MISFRNCSSFDLSKFSIAIVFLTSTSVLTLLSTANGQQANESTDATEASWAIALHGGAGNVPRNKTAAELAIYQASLNAALKAGTDILESGGTALEAVTATVMLLENDPLYNAGKGGVFNAQGEIEMDASIMDGATLKCGGVSGMTMLKNPIMGARVVMEKTDHVLMAGPQANMFCISQGCEAVDPKYFFTGSRWNSFQKSMRQGKRSFPAVPLHGFPEGFQPAAQPPATDEAKGTVGCVALDQNGNLAAATSTGGRTGKLPGRIGDSPVIGAGTFANENMAFSGTGRGEEYIRHSLAARMAWMVGEQNMSLEAAGKKCLTEILAPKDGGLIAVDQAGNLFLDENTGSMARAWAKSDGTRKVAIWENPL
ncbi:MAG: isoaspartyl peptidase/L-asparaginase [Fuerstiella sp.]